MRLKPVCVGCQRFFRIKKTGFYFVEGMPAPGTRHAPPGKNAPNCWQPYKLWSGDLWECEGCGNQIVAGVGQNPIKEHYEPEFEETRQRLGATFQVNDC